MAKQHLVGLKERTLRSLADQGALVKPIDKVLHENVLPWLIEKMTGFLEEEKLFDINADVAVEEAYKASI